MIPTSNKYRFLFVMGLMGALILMLAVLMWKHGDESIPFATVSASRQSAIGERHPDQNSQADHVERELGKPNAIGEIAPDRARLISLLGKKAYTITDDIDIYHLMLAEAEIDPSWVFQTLGKSREIMMSGYYKNVLNVIYETESGTFYKNCAELAPGGKLRVSPKFLSGICALLADNLTDVNSVPAINRLYKECSRIDDGYLRVLAATNLEKAIQLVARLDVGADKKLEMKGCIASTLALDGRPQEALEIIRDDLGVKITVMHDQALYHIFTKTPGEITSVLHSASTESLIHIAGSLDLVKLIAERGSTADTELLLSKVPFTAAFLKSFETVISSTFSSSPDAGLKQINDLPDGAARDQILASSFEALTDIDGARAILMLESMSGADAGVATRAVAKSLAVSDFESSLRVARQADENLQQDAYREIASASAYQKPDNAVMILEDPVLSQKIGADFRAEMLNTTVQTWAKQDLQAAQQWVEKLSPNDAPKGVQGLISIWMKSDPVAASAWLSNQPGGAARDAGAQVVIDQIKDTDPEMAEKWRKTLPSAK